MGTETKSPDRVSVVYVVGSGRSGTTLLDTILSNHPRFYGAGELGLLSVDNLFHRFYCPCGRPVDQCSFWCGVLQNWFQRTGLESVEEHAKARQPFEGPRLHGLSRLLREKLSRSRSFTEYTRQTVELYRAIRDVSGRDVIVDSSAIPMRALALSMMPEIDLRLIHLVRDGRGVAWSLKRGLREAPQAGICTTEFPRPVWRSAMTWAAYNLTSSWVCHQVPADRALFCRYEDLAENSENVLRRIGDFLGENFEEIIALVNAGGALKVGCTYGGNRMRMNGTIRLRLDDAWKNNLTSGEQRILWRMCGWLMRKYGYSMQA